MDKILLKNDFDLSNAIEKFGDEWKEFNFSDIEKNELIKSFNQYFEIFPWDQLPENSSGFDMGCGSGRWAQFVAPRVKKLFCIDPSEAINIAKKNLDKFDNIKFLKETN